jgi:hypothetical protein
MDESKNGVTLKALANVSPGFALKPWVQKMPDEIVRNPEGVARLRLTNAGATPSELLLREIRAFSQGCQSATLGWN